MGGPIGRTSAKSTGHDVTVYRTTKSAHGAETIAGFTMGRTPKAAAEGAECVFCVGNDDDCGRFAWATMGAFAGMDEGAIFCTTKPYRRPDHARITCGAAAAGQIALFRCAISGGQSGRLENGNCRLCCAAATPRV